MKKIRVAINGFGRIGRAFVKVARENPDIEVVAVNDLGNIANFAYLLKYDTAYGVSPFDVTVKGNSLVVDGHEVKFISEKDPTKLPWKDLDIDVVVESTDFDGYECRQAQDVRYQFKCVLHHKCWLTTDCHFRRDFGYRKSVAQYGTWIHCFTVTCRWTIQERSP